MKNIIFLVLTALTVSTLANADAPILTGKALFGDLKARQIGPAVMSGRINDLEVHPKNDRVIYVGAAGGGVWRSTNGGASFVPIFDKHVQSIGVVKVDPVKPDKIIYVGTGETWTRNSVSTGTGLFRSLDGGDNWTNIGFKKSERIAGVAINPKNNKELYVCVLGQLWSDSKERGVFKSSDFGKTWKKILYVKPDTGCSDIIMDPKKPNTLYASMWEFRRTAWSFNSGGNNSALYKSTDGGNHWHKIQNGFPKGKLGRIAVAVAPSDSKIVYAVLETEKDKDKGLYRSNNGGKSWQHLNSDFGLVVRPFYFSRIVVDPSNPDVVVKAGLNGSISRDGGKTFKNLGPMHPDIHDIVFDIHNSDRMYVATDGGLYRTWDGATTMEKVANLPLSQFYQVSVDNETPYNIYGGLQDNGSWYGPSSSPGGIEARDWHSIGFGDGFRVYRHHTKKIIYSEMQGAETIWRYNVDKDEVKTIQPLPEKGDPKLRFNWNASMALSDSKPDRIYVGSQFLFRSDNMGDTWKKISPDLTTNDKSKQNQVDSGGLSKDNSGAENYGTIFTIAESPLNSRVVWVGTDDGQVQITKNNGKSWTNVTKNIPNLLANTWVYHIEASSINKATAYAVFDGHTRGDRNTYIYKTNDYGKTWHSIVGKGIFGFARSLQEDFVNPNLLFAGTEQGLFITIDGGKTWNHFTNNMPPVSVRFITMQKQTNDLVMATHGRGVIILDDISFLRQLTPKVMAEKVHFFKTKPTEIDRSSGFGGGSTEMEFVGPNPDHQAKIVYYLKKRHIFGKTSLKIYDKNDQMVADLPTGKSKGINIVNWSYHLKRPKVAKGKSITFGGFATPRVPAGTYKVVLTMGKNQYQSSVKLINDKNTPYSNRDRKRLHRFTMDLYHMSENLAYMVYEVDAYIDAANKVEGNSTKSMLDKLNALKKTLVVTTGDNYVGTADPELREDLASLFSKLASGFAPPSNSEKANKKLLDERMAKANSEFKAIQDKEIKSFLDAGHKVALKTKETFIAEP